MSAAPCSYYTLREVVKSRKPNPTFTLEETRSLTTHKTTSQHFFSSSTLSDSLKLFLVLFFCKKKRVARSRLSSQPYSLCKTMSVRFSTRIDIYLEKFVRTYVAVRRCSMYSNGNLLNPAVPDRLPSSFSD